MKVQGQRQSSGCMSSIDAQANHNKTIIAQLLTSKKEEELVTRQFLIAQIHFS